MPPRVEAGLDQGMRDLVGPVGRKAGVAGDAPGRMRGGELAVGEEGKRKLHRREISRVLFRKKVRRRPTTLMRCGTGRTRMDAI